MKGAAQKMPLYPVVKMDTQDDRDERRERMAMRAAIIKDVQTTLNLLKSFQAQVGEARAQRKPLKEGTPEAVLLDAQIEELRELMVTESDKAQAQLQKLVADWALNTLGREASSDE